MYVIRMFVCVMSCVHVCCACDLCVFAAPQLIQAGEEATEFFVVESGYLDVLVDSSKVCVCECVCVRSMCMCVSLLAQTSAHASVHVVHV